LASQFHTSIDSRRHEFVEPQSTRLGFGGFLRGFLSGFFGTLGTLGLALGLARLGEVAPGLGERTSAAVARFEERYLEDFVAAVVDAD